MPRRHVRSPIRHDLPAAAILAALAALILAAASPASAQRTTAPPGDLNTYPEQITRSSDLPRVVGGIDLGDTLRIWTRKARLLKGAFRRESDDLIVLQPLLGDDLAVAKSDVDTLWQREMRKPRGAEAGMIAGGIFGIALSIPITALAIGLSGLNENSHPGNETMTYIGGAFALGMTGAALGAITRGLLAFPFPGHAVWVERYHRPSEREIPWSERSQWTGITVKPDSVLASLSRACAAQDLAAFSALLAEDFTYTFGDNPGALVRDVYLRASAPLFDPDSCRNLSLTFAPGYEVVPGEIAGTWTIRNLTSTLALDDVGRAHPGHRETVSSGVVIEVRRVADPHEHFRVASWRCPAPGAARP